MGCGKVVMLSVVSCAIGAASVVGCAAPAIEAAQTQGTAASVRIAEICQNVMGLSPTERLTGGQWLGNEKLDYWTSHYRGCLVSLADSLQSARDTQVVHQAEDRCRAKGLPPGSPDLAICVLQTANEHPEPTESRAASAAQATVSAETAAPGSFYFASPHETARREQIACAALGLSPAQTEFKTCVQQLRATFYAIDHPID